MNLLKNAAAYRTFLGQCTQCGHCTDACDSLITAEMTLGDIAEAMLAADRESGGPDDLRHNIATNAQLVQAVRGCFFCTSCQNTCFAHNDVCNLIYHARTDFQELDLIERGAWSSVLVDQEWDIFTAYRAIHGIGFTDLTRHIASDAVAKPANDCEVAFFPGCSLAAYAPDLTREIFAKVEELGGKTTMLDHCCGSPLKSAGFYERAEALCDKIADEIVSSGASEVVCVCPGCANAMKATLSRRNIAVATRSLPEFLNSRGYKAEKPLPATPLCISKSCQDRDGSYLEETLKVLGLNADDTPTIFSGCCGAGGAVSEFDPERQSQQADDKLSFAEDHATVVSMCPTCTYTYAFRLMNNPRDVANKHYAELLFESQFDWDLVFAQLGSMWSGEYGAWLASVFA